MTTASNIGFDLPSVSSILNFQEKLTPTLLNLKKDQIAIKLRNGEITRTQYNQLISELDSKPVYGTNSNIPENIQNLFTNPKNLNQNVIKSIVSLKPILVNKEEIEKVKSLIKVVGVDQVTIKQDNLDKPFSPRLLNWVEPYEVNGFLKTLFYTEVNSGLKAGQRVFIVNGNYDSNLLIEIDKYKRARDGYKILEVDNCKLVLDIDYTGVLPYQDESIDNFIKIQYVRDRNEFIQINRQLTTRGGNVSSKFSFYQNNIAFFDTTYSPVTGWGDSGGISSAGFYVRDDSSIPPTWFDITTQFVTGSFSVALSPSYYCNQRFKVLGESFVYNGKTYQEGFVYKWNIGPTQSDWVVDVTYHKPIVTKTNFRDGYFSGKWSTGVFGRQDKTITWDGDKSTFLSGTILNTNWNQGKIESYFTLENSFFADFDEYGQPYQKASLANNNGRGFNYIIDSTLRNSTINNGSFFNSIIATSSTNFPIIESHLLNSTFTYSNQINRGYFEFCSIKDSLVNNAEITGSRNINSKFVKSKLINSNYEETVIKDSTFISDNIIKIEDYDEWSASEVTYPGSSHKIYKFYVTKKNWERLKNKDFFYIRGLNIKNNSKDVLNFFDKKFILSSWTNYDDYLSSSSTFIKRGVEYSAFLSSPLDNEYKTTTVYSGLSYSTGIGGFNEKSGYSIDIMISTIDILGSQLSDINFNRDLTPSPVSSPTMSTYLGNIIDISNAYIIDSDFNSGLFETSNWVNGNNINYNNDLNLTLPSPTGGYYSLSIGSTSSKILNVTTTYNNLYPETDNNSLQPGNIVFLNSVYYINTKYVESITITNPGTNYINSTGVATSASPTGNGLTVDIVASGAIISVTINNSGNGYEIGDVVTILDGDLNATITITSINSSSILLPNDYKILSNDLNGNLEIQEIIGTSSTSVFDSLKLGGVFYTPDAQNRYGYLYKNKFFKSKIKSGIFRRSFFYNSLIENDDYNVLDRDYANLSRIRNLVVADSLFKNGKNILSSATYLYSHFISGDNIWTNGIIQNSIWNGMTFSNGLIKESRWVNGTFNSGVFYNSRSFNAEPSVNEPNHYTEGVSSYYKDGITSASIFNDRYTWQNGLFRIDNKKKTSEFLKSDWENGTLESGWFYNSKWYDGIAIGGLFGSNNLDSGDTMFYNGTVSNVIVENANFYATDTSFQQLTGKKINWLSGIFNNGIFGTDYNQYTASNTATWYDGTFNNGQFISMAKWKTGTFNNGKFISAYGWTLSNTLIANNYGWEDGVFNNGQFGEGNLGTNSTWYYGQFNNGTFKGRVWNNGIFERGEFKGSSTYSSVSANESYSAKLFVDSFQSEYYGLWRDGYFTDQKDKLIKNIKIWSKKDREETSSLKKSYSTTKITNALWLNGTFSHQSGEAKNIVWLNGTFDKGKMIDSSFNPYVRRDDTGYNVWQYAEQPESIYNGGFTNSVGGWLTDIGFSILYSSYSTFSLVNDEAYFVADYGAPALYLTQSTYTIEQGTYQITFDIVTYSSPYNNLSLGVKSGESLKMIIDNVDSSHIGTNQTELELESGLFSIFVSSDEKDGSLTIDNLSVKKSPTASLNIDDSCIWIDGSFDNGDFYISKWQNGNFGVGTAYGMIWQSGISNYMNAFNVFWEDGIWKNGNWYGSAVEFDGTVESDFNKQLLFRGMNWMGTSSCHLWNVFKVSGEENQFYSATSSDAYLDDTIDTPI